MSAALLCLIAGLTAAAPADAAAPPAKRPVVLVLYFDNETNNRDFDVLQKGLADMMVTDLIASGAADVVEREKLQALVDELNLQRTKYFDSATAQKLGKLVGATHAVVGAIQEAKDRLRLSVRVIEQDTAKVLVAQEVFGPKDELFELQQRLVTLMLAALDVKLGRKTQVHSAGNVDALLSYSKAVDLADHGELTLAATRMAEVLQRSPGSELARDQKDALARRLRAAGERRRAAGDEVRRQLRAKAESVLAGAGPLVKLGDLKAARQLTYRVIRGQCLALGVKARLTPKPMHNIPEGREAEVRALVEAYRDNLLALDRELTEWRGPWRWLPDPGRRAAARAARADRADRARAAGSRRGGAPLGGAAGAAGLLRAVRAAGLPHAADAGRAGARDDGRRAQGDGRGRGAVRQAAGGRAAR